jgi:hypothetical protein
MRSWAQRSARRTASTLLLTVGLAGAGTAFAGTALAAGPVTSGNGSALSGNQVVAPVTVPVNICGNAVSAAGASLTRCAGCAAAVTASNAKGSPRTSGDGSVLSGNQVIVPITIPVNIAGNALSVLGLSAASAVSNVLAGTGAAGVPVSCAGKAPVAVHPHPTCTCQEKPGKSLSAMSGKADGTPVAATRNTTVQSAAQSGTAALPGAVSGAVSSGAASTVASKLASGANAVVPGLVSKVQGLPGVSTLSGVAGQG